MKAYLLLVLLISVSFSIYVGEAVSQMEKTWFISSEGTIRDVRLNGTFIAMNDFQQIEHMEATEGARFEQYGDEISLIYENPELSGEKNITAVATIHTVYPLRISSDPPFSGGDYSASAYGLVIFDRDISDSAHRIAAGKSGELEVIAAIAEWTNRYIEYNISYWGDPAPATEVFWNPNGVCVGYTHLFIAMAKAVGFETRFVSGYAFAGEWQAHAWAEVKIGGEWIPVDPTFGEMGILDARHVATSYSNDQSEVFDSLIAKGENFTFSSNVSFGTSEEHMFQKFFSVHTILFGDGLEVVVFNPTDFYATPTYFIDMPDYILPDDSRILVIPPRSSITIRYTLNTAELEPGYTHEIPYEIRMQGSTFKDKLSYVKGVPASLVQPPLINETQASSIRGQEAACPLMFIPVLLALSFSVFYSRKQK